MCHFLSFRSPSILFRCFGYWLLSPDHSDSPLRYDLLFQPNETIGKTNESLGKVAKSNYGASSRYEGQFRSIRLFQPVREPREEQVLDCGDPFGFQAARKHGIRKFWVSFPCLLFIWVPSHYKDSSRKRQ